MDNQSLFTLSDLQNALHAETKRQQFAESKDFTSLRDLYSDTADQLPSMNSPLKWDFFSGRDFTVPDSITRGRVKLVSDQLVSQKNVLDYGCGYAYVLDVIQERGIDLSYLGVDFAPGFIDKLKSRFPEKSYPKVRFLSEASDSLPQETFDTVLLLEVLEHVRPCEVLDLLATLRERLIRDGKLIVSVPLFEDLEPLTVPCHHCGMLGNPNGHVRSYTPELMEAEAYLAGFELQLFLPVFRPLRIRARLMQQVRVQLLRRARLSPSNGVFVFKLR